jgi:Mg2+-importing ATPase
VASSLDVFWSASADQLFEELRSRPEGLRPDDARSRLATAGRNLLATRPRAGLARLFFRQLANPLVLILAIAAAVAALVGEPVQSLIVLAVLLGSAIVTLIQEYRGTRAIEELQALLVLKTTVVRGGAPREIPAEEVVPGDVVLLSAGSLIPADGVVFEARDLFVNQSVLTGESFPVEKMPGTVSPTSSLAERTNVALMGTSIRSGTGRMLVVLTGANTAYGDVSRRLTLRAPETEFERGIRHFGYLVAQVIVLLVLFVFAANVFLDRPPVEALLFAIALAVGMSPELLPAIVSVTLAQGAREMAKGGVIVRQLTAIENFGSMDVLCCDKTGTLTEGRVRLESALDPEGNPSEEVLKRARENARFQTGIRNPLDEAILADAPAGLDNGGNVRKVDEIPYDFVRRRITVVVEDESGTWLVTKGAVTQTVASCARIRGAAGPVGGAERAAIENRVAGWGDQGYRVLAVAQKEVERRERYSQKDERGLTLIGFLLFEDRAKDGVKTVLDELRTLGVGVKIITGDSRHAARHVAASVGLDSSRLLTAEGADHRGPSEDGPRGRVPGGRNQ